MNFDELEGLRGLSKDPSLNFAPKDSRACAGAMRALQDRLRLIETENAELHDKIIVLETRSSNDREKWQIRMMEEVQLAKDKENLLQNRLKERDEEISKLHLKISNMEEHVKIKETQCRHSENEVKRTNDQFSIDIESLNLQIEYLHKSLNDKNSEGKSSQIVFEKIEREKSLIEEELKQERKVSHSLQSEVKYIRENSEQSRISMQKNYDSMEKELNKQISEQAQKIKELEIKNKSLRDMNNNYNRQIDHLKKENFDLQKSKKNNEQQKIEALKNKSLGSKKVISKSMSKPTLRSKSPGTVLAHKKDKSISHNKDTQENEEDLKHKIMLVEKDLEKLNQRYKSLLSISHKDNGDLATVRKDMAKIASDIDIKSEELFDMKKKQQSYLRAKLFY